MINDRQVDINVLGRKYMKGCKNEMGKNTYHKATAIKTLRYLHKTVIQTNGTV